MERLTNLLKDTQLCLILLLSSIVLLVAMSSNPGLLLLLFNGAMIIIAMGSAASLVWKAKEIYEEEGEISLDRLFGRKGKSDLPETPQQTDKPPK